jgi:ketosteroid isomerase-like protein
MWVAGVTWLALASAVAARGQTPPQEIPLRHCDRLPVVTVRVGKSEMSFLVDTAASSLLNSKSFSSSSGHATDVRIASWTGTTATGAREVSLPELTLGDRTLRNLKLSAVDLSAIAKACNGTIDGILGVDLLEQLGMTIDLRRRVARLGAPQADPAEASLISEMEDAMRGCSEAFNAADRERLEACFDPDLVLSTPWGEYRGREKVVEYLDQRFFALNLRVRLSMRIHDQRAVGDVVWTSYDYSMDSRDIHLAGRGMMLCRKEQDRWYILSIHDTLNPAEEQSKTR